MNDRRLVTLLNQGRPEALAALSARYRSRIASQARRVLRDAVDAEDVAEEVMLRAASGPAIRDAGSLETWLRRVCHRLAIDRLRRRDRERPLEDEADAQSRSPDDDRAQGDERRAVGRALERLAEPYRTAIVLRYLRGREFRDIALEMDTPERTARTWVGRGLAMLRQELRAGQ